MRLLVVIDQLEMGGAGRVCSILVNGLVARGYDVSICTAVKYHTIQYEIPNQVLIKEWYDPEPVKHNLFGKFLNICNRRKYYRNALKEVKPDLIVVFTYNMYFYVKLWSLFYRKPIIVSDHTSMGRDLGWFANYIRHKYYAKADAVTILTQKDAQLLGDKLPNKIVVYNPVTFDNLNHSVDRNKTVICVGRKDYWKVKGFDRILEIWSRVANKYPDWSLEIIGPGKQESENILKKIADKYGILNQVKFTCAQSEMELIYQSSSIFALPSRVEGFPMVLLEAMSQGCACVTFAMQGAIEEIISDGIDGDIVEDGDLTSFANKLDLLISDSNKREKYSINGRKSVTRFSKTNFIDKWEQIIQEVLNR